MFAAWVVEQVDCAGVAGWMSCRGKMEINFCLGGKMAQAQTASAVALVGRKCGRRAAVTQTGLADNYGLGKRDSGMYFQA